ncbi:MAG: DotU family type IV/VI secretion system protein [Rhizomicrobium sp.]
MATSSPPAPAESPFSNNLAIVFQEVLTVVERLRANRQQVGNAAAFRAQIRNSLGTAEQEALRRGYTQEDVRVATFAVVAFLDESILNSRAPVFADWARKPLQEEVFGVHVAGEIFFNNLDRLLGRQDSEALADLLEVYQLCLLLGFRGRYGASASAEIRSYIEKIGEKIRRVRKPVTPPWQIAPEVVLAHRDRWIPALRWLAIGCAIVAIILFVAFKFSLSSSAGELQAIAARVGS